MATQWLDEITNKHQDGNDKEKLKLSAKRLNLEKLLNIT